MEPIALTIHKEQESRAPEAWSPLDVLVIHVETNDKALPASQADLMVFDGQKRNYFARHLFLDKDTTKVSFVVGGAVGRHRIEIKLSESKSIAASADFCVKATTSVVSLSAPDYTDFFNSLHGLIRDLPRWYSLTICNKKVRGIFWIRDHTHCLKGFKYFEPDLKNMVNLFLDNQMPGGGYYDFFELTPDKSAAALNSAGEVIFKRQDCEADLEYLLVEAVHAVWQATGDDDWMQSCLTKLEKGLHYAFSHPRRWSKEHQLLKRPFTIDTWDFEYLEEDPAKSNNRRLIAPNGWLLRMIDGRTKFCIMHGDNSGLMKACHLMALMWKHSGSDDKNRYWEEQAKQIRGRANRVCWNGRFYTHQVHIDPVNIPVDESCQLSLSNTYDINRGLPSHRQAVNIIREYQRRKEMPGSFAEWFSIDPPFPNGVFKEGFSEDAKDYVFGDAFEYINGTVMPLVGGELARACFEHGFELYGVDILRRLHALIKRDGKLYFMYNRDGTPWHLRGLPEQEGGPNLWGTTAILYALMEGLAGIEDCHKLYQKVRISPRWAATKALDVKIIAAYESSRDYIAYHYRYDQKSNVMVIDVAGSAEEILLHVLMPEGHDVKTIRTSADKQIIARAIRVEKSLYVDFELSPAENHVAIYLMPEQKSAKTCRR